MSAARLRLGELIATVGLVGLFVSLFFVWFTPDTGRISAPGVRIPDDTQALVDGRSDAFRAQLEQTGWSSLGWFALVLAALAMIVCAAWLIATLTQSSPALPVALQVWTLVGGVVLTLVVLERLLFVPDLGYGADADAQAAGLVGLLCAVLVGAGAFVSVKDERTGAAGSQPGEIELRPIPGPTTR